MTPLTYLIPAVLAIGCTVASLPPSSSRTDGGPVAARGTVTHEARSQLRLYRDAAGCESVQTFNRQFRLVSVRLPGGSPRRLVLEEAYDVRHCLTAESSSSEATVTGWRPDSAAKEPVFRVTGRGVRGEPIGNLYQMAAAGCCGSQDLFTYFSLVTGRTVLSSSLPVVSLDWVAPPTARFAGVHDTYSAGAPPEVAGDSSVVGVVSWADDQVSLQRIAIVAAHPEPFAAAAIMFWRDGQPVSGSMSTVGPNDSATSIELQVDLVAPADDRRATVRIPVEGLRLVPEKAKLPSGFRLRPMP